MHEWHDEDTINEIIKRLTSIKTVIAKLKDEDASDYCMDAFYV